MCHSQKRREYQQKCVDQCLVGAIEYKMFHQDTYLVACRGRSQLFEGGWEGNFIDKIAGSS